VDDADPNDARDDVRGAVRPNIDPFFISLFVIVGFGIALTATGYILDRRNGATVTAPTTA